MSNANYYRKIASNTGFCCILCGREFAHTGVVSKEHVIPRVFGGNRYDVLPAHMRCNEFRGNASLVRVAAALALSARRDPERFDAWANCRYRGNHVGGVFKYTDPPNLSREELEHVHGPYKRFRKLQTSAA